VLLYCAVFKYTRRQKNRHKYTLIATILTPIWGEIINRTRNLSIAEKLQYRQRAYTNRYWRERERGRRRRQREVAGSREMGNARKK